MSRGNGTSPRLIELRGRWCMHTVRSHQGRNCSVACASVALLARPPSSTDAQSRVEPRSLKNDVIIERSRYGSDRPVHGATVVTQRAVQPRAVADRFVRAFGQRANLLLATGGCVVDVSRGLFPKLLVAILRPACEFPQIVRTDQDARFPL